MRMHNVLESWIVSTEIPNIIGSLWTRLLSRSYEKAQ